MNTNLYCLKDPQGRYWKKDREAQRAARRAGWKTVKVAVTEIT